MADDPSKIKEIFMAALEKTTADRATYLEEACAGDPALRRRLESLLSAHDRTDPLLDQPAIHHFEEEAKTATSWSADSVVLNFLEPPKKPGALGRLGHYEVMEVVGKGAMGIVMRAFDEKLQRIVAIKVLAPDLALEDEARQRFVKEARAAAAVTHDNVIAIHGVEGDAPIPYLIMQFIEGRTLQQKLERSGPLPLSEILRLGIQIADGLAAAHRHGLIHRDVKPANILLENGVERVKITDFGLARAVDDATLTQSGIIAGTPAYMSPEQARGEKLDYRSDLFSLGSVLYALCAGHAPFRAGSALAVMNCVCEETARSIRELNPSIPEWLEAIVARLHSKDPASRFASAREVAGLMSRGLTQVQGGSAASTTLRKLVPHRRIWSRRRAAGISAALIVIVGLVGYFAWKERRQPNATAGPEGPAQPLAQTEPWKPRPPLTPEELAHLPDPLTDWQLEEMPAGTLSLIRREGNDSLDNLIALLGDGPFRIPRRGMTHWPVQSADGRLLALPNGADVVIYDTKTGAALRTLLGHTDRTLRGSFSSDSKRYACAAQNGAVRIWDVESGKEQGRADNWPDASWTAQFAPGDKLIVLAGEKGLIKVWDWAAGPELKTLSEQKGGIPHIAFNSDGTCLATGVVGGLVKIWSWPGFKLLKTLEGNREDSLSVAYSADGAFLACGSTSRVLIWDAKTFELLHTLPTAGDGLLGFTPDGQTLLTAPHLFPEGKKRAFASWDVKTGKELVSFDVPGPRSYLVGLLSGDGSTVYLMTCDPVEPILGAYDAVSGKERFATRDEANLAWSVAFSPDGRWLASAGNDGQISLWDLTQHRAGQFPVPARVLTGHKGEVWSVAFSPDGQLLASGGKDETIRLWNVADGHEGQVLSGSTFPAAPLAFSPDGETLAAGSQEGGANLWNVKTGQPKEPVRWHTGPVRTVVFSPDGRWLATGGLDRTVQLIDRGNGQRVHTFRSETPITGLAFSPDSKTLAGSCIAPGPSLYLWDIVTRKERIRRGHTKLVFGIAFHPAGNWIATGSADGTVRTWGTSPGADESHTFDFRRAGACNAVAFSPSGRHLAVALDNGMIAILKSR
jgi:WD40 repeat protein